MTTIRADLVGTVHVRDENDIVHILSAGDEVPEGATVGEHLIDGEPDDSQDDDPQDETEDGEPDDDPKGDAGDEVPEGAPRGNASRAAWASYATAHGVEVSDEMSREDIKAALSAE